MKAVIVRHYGGPEALELADLPVPDPGTGQVRVRVQAAAVNPVDIATRAGRLAEHGLMTATGAVGIGWDLAGVIDAVGPDGDARRDYRSPAPARCPAPAGGDLGASGVRRAGGGALVHRDRRVGR